MIKDLFRFSGKLLLIAAAVLVFTFIGLTLILGADGISTAIKVIASAFFLLFLFGLLLDNCARRGAEDCKAVITYRRGRGTQEQLDEAKGKMYYPLKGFLAAAIPMLIPFVLVVVCTVLQYRGWEKSPEAQYAGEFIYNLLFYAFMAYTPVLVLATPCPTTLTVKFGIPAAAANFDNMYIPNMVYPYLFIIPIIIFIAAAGIFYIMGYNSQKRQVPQHMMPVYFPAKGQLPITAEEAEARHQAGLDEK